MERRKEEKGGEAGRRGEEGEAEAGMNDVRRKAHYRNRKNGSQRRIVRFSLLASIATNETSSYIA